VVHRDLKPANIMIVPTGARRNALVLDFGIGALTAVAASGGDARITASSEIVCTPSYAAPEQVRGMAPTARSDLYAWALVFLECLTGRPAVTGGSPQEVLLQQVSAAPIAIAAPLLDHPLGAILRRATVKDVAARAVTADGLLRELEACDVAGLSREDLAGRTSGVDIRVTTPVEIRATSPSPSPPAPAPIQPGEPARSIEGERRPLTVVCCSLAAAGPGLETIDVEEVDEVLGEEQEVCGEIARRHGGFVAGALGERMFLYFGYPVAEEDDARRAARAAIAIGEDVRARSERLAAARGVALDARIGIHTGLVIARVQHGNAQSFGTTTQIAARLSELAAPGAIVASGETFRLLRGRFNLLAGGARAVPGVAQPVEIYQVQGESPAASLHRPPDSSTTRLVGRGQEIELLVQRWNRAREGTGQCVLLTGGPGIGKSRLVNELARRLRGETCTYLECHCAEEIRRSALRPVIDMIDRQLVEAGGVGPASRLERMESLLLRRRFDLGEVVPLLAGLLEIPLGSRYAPPEGSPQRRQERTFAILCSLLCETAEEQPVLFVVEDLHWADPLTLEWLGALVEEASEARIMALLTARPDLSLPWPSTGMVRIELGRLEREHVEELARDVADGRPLPGPVLQQIVDRTDGVPLFVEELTRMVLASGELEGRGALLTPAGELAIPSTLRGLLAARLDRLGRARETAQLASALGREFSLDVLEAVSRIDPAALREDLDQLVAADLVHRRRRTREATYFFKHGLIRDAAYESLPRRARLRVHAHIARRLEERFPEICRTRPGVLAHHHAAADQKRQAIAYAERAAELALGSPAGGADDTEAVEHLEHALGWLASFPEDRERSVTELRLNSKLILAIMDRRGYMDRKLAAAVKRSEELSDALGDSPLTAPTLFALFEYHNLRNHRPRARALAERLVRMADEIHDDAQAGWALPLLGDCLFNEGRLAEARGHLERALRLYDPATHQEQAFAYGVDSRVYAASALSMALSLMGYPDRALAEGEAAVAWARELDHPNSLGVALLFLAGVHHYARARDKVAEVSLALTALTDRYRLWIKDYGWLLRGWAEGDLERIEELVTKLRSSEQRNGLTYWISLEAEILAERGRHDAALARLDDCLQLATETGETYYVPELYRLKALSLEACDVRATSESEACLRQAIAAARQEGARMPELRATIALCRSLRRQGRREEAAALLEDASAWPAEHAALPELDEARGLLRELLA
jgi:TOMM system kinase/cyclase fusion protein